MGKVTEEKPSLMKKIKYHPKTKGYSVSHICGHEAKHRTHLLWLAKAERNESSDRDVAELIGKRIKEQELIVCPVCSATEEYAAARSELEALFRAVGLELPNELTGTIRQKAWAESCRTFAVKNLMRSVADTIVSPRMSTLFIIRVMGGTDFQLSPELRALADQFEHIFIKENHAFEVFFGEKEIIKETIPVAILAIREALTNSFRFNVIQDSKTWMMWSKDNLRTGYPPDVFIDPNLILRSYLALKLNPTGNLNELLGLQRFLHGYAYRDDVQAFNNFKLDAASDGEIADLMQVNKAMKEERFPEPF